VAAHGGKRGREHGVFLKRGTLNKKDSISRMSDGTGGFSVAWAVFNFLEVFSLKKN
jgi:hypothetical protein